MNIYKLFFHLLFFTSVLSACIHKKEDMKYNEDARGLDATDLSVFVQDNKNVQNKPANFVIKDTHGFDSTEFKTYNGCVESIYRIKIGEITKDFYIPFISQTKRYEPQAYYYFYGERKGYTILEYSWDSLLLLQKGHEYEFDFKICKVKPSNDSLIFEFSYFLSGEPSSVEPVFIKFQD